MFGQKERHNHFALFDTYGNPGFSGTAETFLDYFEKSPIIFSVISIILSSVDKVKFKNIDNKVINLNQIILSLILTGNCFICKDIGELKHIQTSDIAIHLDSKGHIDHFSDKKSDKKINKVDLLHIKYLNSKGSFFGMSPLKSLQTIIESHLSILKYIYNFIENNGRPSGIISYKDIISPSMKNTVRKELYKMHSNIGKEGSVGILEGEFTWQSIGSTPKDMQILEIKQELEKIICHTLGVPPILLGIIDAKFNNYKEAIDFFEQNTIKSILDLILYSWNQFFHSNIEEDI